MGYACGLGLYGLDPAFFRHVFSSTLTLAISRGLRLGFGLRLRVWSTLEVLVHVYGFGICLRFEMV